MTPDAGLLALAVLVGALWGAGAAASLVLALLRRLGVPVPDDCPPGRCTCRGRM